MAVPSTGGARRARMVTQPGQFSLDLLDRRPAQAVARLVGEVDLFTAPQLHAVLSDLFDEGVRTLTLDLSQLEFIDSTGLAELVVALKRHRDGGGDVVLHCPSATAAKVLEVSGLDRVFVVTSDATCPS